MDWFLWRKIAILQLLIASFIINPRPAHAEAPLYCGNYLAKESREIRDNLNENLDRNFVTRGRHVRALWKETVPFPSWKHKESGLYTSILTVAHQKLTDKMFLRLAHAMYTFKLSNDLRGSLYNLELDEIPLRATSNYFCSGCDGAKRAAMQEPISAEIERLHRNGAARLNLQQIREELLTDITALNQLLERADEDEDGWANYQRHYVELTKTTVGQLLFMDPIIATIGAMKSPGDTQPHSLAIGTRHVRSAIQNYYQYFEANTKALTRTTRSALIEAQTAGVEGLNRTELTENHPAVWLSQYMAVAPVLMTEVFKELQLDPATLCYLMQSLDDVFHEAKWKSSINSAKWTLVPFAVAFLVMPFFVTATTTVIYGSLIAMQLYSAYQIVDSAGKASRLGQKARVQQTMMNMGYTTRLGFERQKETTREIESESRDVLINILMEVGALGIANVAHKIYHARYAQESVGGLVEMLYTEGLKRPAVRNLVSREYRVQEWDRKAIRGVLQKIEPERKVRLFFGNGNHTFARKLVILESGLAVANESSKLMMKPLFPYTNPLSEMWALRQDGPGERRDSIEVSTTRRARQN